MVNNPEGKRDPRNLYASLDERVNTLRNYIEKNDFRKSVNPRGNNPYRTVTTALLDEMMITKNAIQMNFDQNKENLKKFYEASFALKGYIDAVIMEKNEELRDQEFFSGAEANLGNDPMERGNKAIEYADNITKEFLYD